MSILIANIGTSDLAIKIDDYYIPVGFDRSEPNINYLGLDDNEKAVWEQELRQSYIIEDLCPKLGVQVQVKKEGKKLFSFRELTKKILEVYKDDEEQGKKEWHHRICPGRIWGVIKTAIDPRFNVKEVYLFVTDQPETEKQGYPSDSIHLFEILQMWFERENPKLKLKKEVIPKCIAANDQDQLLNHYYHFFNQISRHETVLISIKGGTPQMQNALKMQAIASGLPKQLFINPHLFVKKVLNGEPSECVLTSYWRYMRTQKYQAVKLLLENRWDFDGAKQILQDWQKVLKFLMTQKVTEEEPVFQSLKTLEQVIQVLELGLDFLNLDYNSATKILPLTQKLGLSTVEKFSTIQEDEKLLNLYTQCRIYWDIDQVANFLARMSSFYEEIIERLIIILNGQRYCCKDKNNYWIIDTKLLRQEMDENLWLDFLKGEAQYKTWLKNHNFNVEPQFKLEGRFSKRNFIEKLLVPHQNIPKAPWQIVLESLQSLDFWVKQRNKLIHSTSGVSKKRMQDLLDESRRQRETDARLACEPGKIRNVMARICSTELGLIREEYQQQFLEKKANFYLYSDIKNWVLSQLQAESSR